MKLFYLFYILTSLAFAQTEEQRKYIFPQMTEELQILLNRGAVVNGLSVKQHSVYDYMDIYLDTEDLDLYHHQLSLRFRRRVYPDGKKQFGMQIKSEMTVVGAVRMEIEEDELDFYQIYHEGNVYSLQETLDKIFEEYLLATKQNEEADLHSHAGIQEQIMILKTWLSFKVKSALSPMQKLNRVVKDEKRLKTLRPVVMGRSLRTRSHIYIDKNSTTPELSSFKPSTRISSETPELIRGDRYIWTMEASFDQARFYSLISKTSSHPIREFEVENKYLPHEGARSLFIPLETGLIQDYKAMINLESKYRQTIKAMFKK
jgi:hypothetical protein